MSFKLSTPYDAERLVAQLFEANPGSACQLDVLEEQVFSASLGLGTIAVMPESEKAEAEHGVAYFDAIRGGSFEWHLPKSNTVLPQLQTVLGIDGVRPTGNKEGKAHDKALERTSRALNGIASIGTRLGLVYPRFDARSLESMPFRRATTIVVDTSGVLQGALDFVARFLHPIARIKVPAVVHMEIVNQADRFLNQRRSTKPNPGATLMDHILSQGAQRCLLRLELQPDTEIERTAVFGDPLRNAFKRDTDEEFSDLNLSVPLRSYCDRLIVETARQHQSLASPGHSVRIVTSDQGLARMALAEGIEPLFFNTVMADDFFGHLLTGTNFHPFTGELHKISLVDIIWECATTFGKARISNKKTNHSVEVAAIGEGINWSPFHSRDDLLWVRTIGFEPSAVPPIRARESALNQVASSRHKRIYKKSGRDVAKEPSATPTKPVGSYKFNVAAMLSICGLLDKRAALPFGEIQKVVGVKDLGSIAEYRKFLTSGTLVKVDAPTSNWVATDRLYQLWRALASDDHAEAVNYLKAVPSFSMFADALAERRKITPESELPFSRRSLPTYQTLAEILCIGASIVEEGFFATPNNPGPEEFSRIALDHFDRLAKGEQLVSVGAWLESLIRVSGIHPVNARYKLREANAIGALRLITEGSTTDTKYDQHTVKVLKIVHDKPMIETVHLYRGDFLVPNKASVSMRLEERVNGPQRST